MPLSPLVWKTQIPVETSHFWPSSNLPIIIVMIITIIVIIVIIALIVIIFLIIITAPHCTVRLS